MDATCPAGRSATMAPAASSTSRSSGNSRPRDDASRPSRRARSIGLVTSEQSKSYSGSVTVVVTVRTSPCSAADGLNEIRQVVLALSVVIGQPQRSGARWPPAWHKAGSFLLSAPAAPARVGPSASWAMSPSSMIRSTRPPWPRSTRPLPRFLGGSYCAVRNVMSASRPRPGGSGTAGGTPKREQSGRHR